MSNPITIKNILEEAPHLINLTKEEFDYLINSPLGKGIYKHSLAEDNTDYELPEPDNFIKKKKAMPNDRLKCKICGKMYNRSGSALHKKSQIHQTYDKLNVKLRDLLIN